MLALLASACGDGKGDDEEEFLPIAVYVPVGAVGPRPVVLVSHGGTNGHTNPLTSLPEWAELVASAGHVAIAIAHVPRPEPAYSDMCAYLGVEAVPCAIKLNWDYADLRG